MGYSENGSEEGLLAYDIVTLPVMESEKKREALKQINIYLRNGYELIGKYTLTEDLEMFMVFEFATKEAKKILKPIQAPPQLKRVTDSAPSATLAPTPGSSVDFASAVNSHKPTNYNENKQKIDIEKLYKEYPEKYYVALSLANMRAIEAKNRGLKIYNVFSNGAIKRIVDEGIRGREQIENVAELTKNTLKTFGDIITETLEKAYTDIERGIGLEEINALEKTWHDNVVAVRGEK